ncbi:MAG: bifunctional folylpolyglutamate synthase/dihydrofolate synthase [Muribaculaceae bacterium]|nr:bifunctional folylpolyglutamate synthase/dihydrofolate synthase [Muribaculaceae bacterium]
MENIEEKYKESLEYLFAQLPMFSRVGAAAYKPGLERTEALDDLFGNPHRKFRSIHVAGTNGKGSTSHLLASVLQANGYKTALYTSPHLVDFRERIRINGQMIPKEKVIDFTERWRASENDINPSFFELTMMMAFDWFAAENVDIAVIEVGMGGRLDSTNIITPLLSVITNISFDHTQFLGDTLAKIASEKAGIIKQEIPVVIGEAVPETEDVFRNKAKEVNAPIIEAYNNSLVSSFDEDPEWGWVIESPILGKFNLPLAGEYQRKNINTALNAIDLLSEAGIELDKDKIKDGIENVVTNTGLMGRWMRVATTPLTICDTGHNEAGLRYNLHQLSLLLEKRKESKLRFVLGFVSDKDVDHILPLFPKDAVYYITQASIPRAMNADELATKCRANGLNVAAVIPDVKTAANKATKDSAPADIIYIGGSTFVVADYLA